MPKGRPPFTAVGPSNEQEKHMSLKTILTGLLIAEGHDEPVGNLDRLDGVGVESKDSSK
jgi:hypothetical protein